MSSTVTSPTVAEGLAPQGQERIRLSFSRVDTYRTCPLKFRFAYIDELPSQPSPHLSWGSSVHAALEAWWDQKLPQPPPVEVLLQALYDNWDDEGFEGLPREEKLRWYGHAQDVLRRHHERYAPTYVPAVACEEWFELDLGEGIEVVGSIDHIARTQSGGIGIVDWKTNRKAKPRKRVAQSLQLAVYAMAAVELWGQEPEWVALDFVVPGVRVAVDRAEIDTDAARETILQVAQLVRSEAFDPTPSALCPWCDYRAECPAFAGEGPDLPATALVELKRLRRRRQRDEDRISQLEAIVLDRLGPEATLEIGA
ncbi:MAG TPA: PD-(D/E)XK nuclease family protein [Egibacteraceae bacterium]|nr:PD-(D/E)XK nuclease family protein [Egibacteraceae bacterium]